MTSDATSFRAAMARLGAAVTIVSTNGASGRYGILVSAVCSVSDTPPMLLACVNRNSAANAIIKANGVLCVNVLGCDHAGLSDAFGRATPDLRFEVGQWGTLATGAPVLADAAAVLDCAVEQAIEAGSHSIFLCAVRGIALAGEPSGLIYHQRCYHPIAASA